MLLYVLPVLDTISALFIMLIHYDIFGLKAALFVSIYLISKGIIFRDGASMIDLLIGLFVFAILAGLHTFLTWIAVIYLMQKVFLALINY